MKLSTVAKLVRQRSGQQVPISLEFPDRFNHRGYSRNLDKKYSNLSIDITIPAVRPDAL